MVDYLSEGMILIWATWFIDLSHNNNININKL